MNVYSDMTHRSQKVEITKCLLADEWILADECLLADEWILADECLLADEWILADE